MKSRANSETVPALREMWRQGIFQERWYARAWVEDKRARVGALLSGLSASLSAFCATVRLAVKVCNQCYLI
jgi:hypothetical protein